MFKIIIFFFLILIYDNSFAENYYEVLPDIRCQDILNVKELIKKSTYDSTYYMYKYTFYKKNDLILEYVFFPSGIQEKVITVFVMTNIDQKDLNEKIRFRIIKESIKEHQSNIKLLTGYNSFSFKDLKHVKKGCLYQSDTIIDLGETILIDDKQKMIPKKKIRLVKQLINNANVIDFDSSVDGFVFSRTILLVDKRNKVIASLKIENLYLGTYIFKYIDCKNISQEIAGTHWIPLHDYLGTN